MKRKPAFQLTPPTVERRRVLPTNGDGNGAALPSCEGNTAPKKWPLPRRRVCVTRGELEPECKLLAGYLKLLMNLTHWTLEDLAAITHLDRSYLGDLMTGRLCNPSLDVVVRLAKAFRIKLGKFGEQMELYGKRKAASVPVSREIARFSPHGS